MKTAGSRQLWVRLASVLAIATALAVLILAASADSLPDPLATHWGLDGRPDGHMSMTALLVLTIGLIAGLGGLLGFFMARREGTSAGASVRIPSGESFGLAGFIAVLGLVLTVVTVALNWGRESWEEAGAMQWWVPVGAIMVAVGAGFIGYLTGRRWAPLRPPATTVEPAPISRASHWRGTASSPGQLLGAGIGVAILLLAPGVLRWLGLLLIVLGALMSRLAVVIDAGGVRVRMGGFVPVRRYRLDAISRAGSQFVDPAQWGGWGYRMIPGGSAVVIRAGEGIVLDLATGRRFAVTVDDSEEGAGVVNGLRARAGGRP
jgi:hypothetical protein